MTTRTRRGPRGRWVLGVAAVLVALGLGLLLGDGLVLRVGDDDCPRTVVPVLGSVDWADVVQVGDSEYGVVGDTGGPTDVTEEEVGEAVADVRCQVSDTVTTPYRVRDGEATFLPAGTTLHRVVAPGGSAVDDELVAVLDDGRRLRYRRFDPLQ